MHRINACVVVGLFLVFVGASCGEGGETLNDVDHKNNSQSENLSSCNAAVVRFQQGLDGYSGTQDTEIRQWSRYADRSYENQTTIRVDFNFWRSEYQGLIRFENIFGASGGQVPLDTEIVNASLVLYGVNGTRNDISVYKMLVNWPENATWNGMSNGVSTDDNEAQSTPDDILVAPGSEAYFTLDVTASVIQWQSNPVDNYGWLLQNSGTDAWYFNSSEMATASLRPELVVDYCTQPDPCDGVSCDTPPMDDCENANTLRVFDSTGSCTDGSCHYSFTDATCAFGCSNGACNPDPCDGVSCDSPPVDDCENADTLRVFDSTGSCTDGSCHYNFTDTTCAFGCSNGACNPDPCDGVSCDSPPVDDCENADTLRVFDSTGSCTDGSCNYNFTDTTCAFGCSNGACNPDPCDGVLCITAPDNTCADANHLWTYDNPGTCVDGGCAYSYAETYCDFGCNAGACNPGPCDGVVCDSPPADVCVDANTLRSFDPAGTCTDGLCDYGYTDTVCNFGCSADSCSPDPCDGVSCDTPPADSCEDTNTLRVYDSPGTCSGGECNYSYTDTGCVYGCTNGACESGISVDCTLNPYETVNWVTWGQYKANFHTHTTNSDGSQSPAAVIDEYYSAGYAILAITDHNAITWPWTSYGRDPADLNMLAVRGDEYSNTEHVNAFYDFIYSSQGLENGIPHVDSSGGLSQINHPGRDSSPIDWAWYISWYRDYPSCVGLEVYNQGNRYPNDRRLWDNINENFFVSDGRLVWGYSNDDKHTASHLYRNYQYMLMPELTQNALRTSQQNGAFYFCYEPGGSGNGDVPRIDDIVVDNVSKTITIAASDYNGISWIGPGTTVVATGSTFDFSDYLNMPFVRAVLDGSNGDSYTQPFGFETTVAP